MTTFVTLSSIPPRFSKIGPVLASLASQQVERVLLYIPTAYRRFPDWDGSMPDVPKGVEIRRCEEDFGPATKILPAAHDFAGQNVNLLFADDDHIYAPGWATSFERICLRHSECVIAQGGWQASDYAESSDQRAALPRAVRRWRATDLDFQLRYLWQDLTQGRGLPGPPRRTFKSSGYIDVFEGYAGVLVRPEMFDAGFYDIPKGLWGVDDVWLSGMLTVRGYPIWLEGGLLDPRQAEAERHAPLAKSVIDGADRRNANRLGVEYFQKTHGIWR